MAGGSGERFWPLSRVLKPKQFLRLAHPERTLIEQTVERLQPLIQPQDTYIATAPHLVEPSRALVGGIPAANVQAEPHKRNTAGCLVWVAARLLAEDPNARQTTSMAVLAADHRITPDEGFRATLDACLSLAEQSGGIVTIGIRPDRPETGYGYIEKDASVAALGTAQVPIYPVKQFREKPDRATAEEFLRNGDFLWNSGTFFWTLDTFLSELELAAPDLYQATMQIADQLRSGEPEAAEQIFAGLRNVSIDYALMEAARKVFVAEAAFEWDDVGSWDALDRSLDRDDSGNVAQGDILALDSTECIVVNENPAITACLVGVQNLVVVVTEDAVLICPKNEAQRVKHIVESLRERGVPKL